MGRGKRRPALMRLIGFDASASRACPDVLHGAGERPDHHREQRASAAQGSEMKLLY